MAASEVTYPRGKKGTAIIWIFRQWEIDQLSCAANCSFTCISFNCFRIGVTGTDNGICLQKTFPIWNFIWSTDLPKTKKHKNDTDANRAVISLITAVPYISVNCTSESFFLTTYIFISLIENGQEVEGQISLYMHLHFIKNNILAVSNEIARCKVVILYILSIFQIALPVSHTKC